MPTTNKDRFIDRVVMHSIRRVQPMESTFKTVYRNNKTGEILTLREAWTYWTDHVMANDSIGYWMEPEACSALTELGVATNFQSLREWLNKE